MATPGDQSEAEIEPMTHFRLVREQNEVKPTGDGTTKTQVLHYRAPAGESVVVRVRWFADVDAAHRVAGEEFLLAKEVLDPLTEPIPSTGESDGLPGGGLIQAADEGGLSSFVGYIVFEWQSPVASAGSAGSFLKTIRATSPDLVQQFKRWDEIPEH